MKFEPKFSESEMRKICLHIRENTRECEGEDQCYQMTIGDREMCSILKCHGFDVNVKFVERTRNKLGIKSRGSSPRKFTESQLKEMEELVCYFAYLNRNCWQMTVSDADLCKVLCDLDFSVNTKYVERLRRSLGIEPLGERGGLRAHMDQEYANMKSIQAFDAYQLSYRRNSQGALRGQSGSDIKDDFGYHAVDLESAIKIKNIENTRGNAPKRIIRAILNETREEREDEAQNEIAAIFEEEINGRCLYGKVGKAGGVHSVAYTQAQQARFGQ